MVRFGVPEVSKARVSPVEKRTKVPNPQSVSSSLMLSRCLPYEKEENDPPYYILIPKSIMNKQVFYNLA